MTDKDITRTDATKESVVSDSSNGTDGGITIVDPTTQPEDSLSPADATARAQSVIDQAPDFRPGIEPRKSPKARGWLFVIGLLLIALGGIAVREVLVLTDQIGGPEWFTVPLNWLGNAHWMRAFIVAAAAAIVLGLIIFVAAVSPRSKTHVPVDEEASVWVRPVDVARMCSSRVEKVHGVLSAHTVATRKKITVTARGKVSDTTLEGRIREAVTPVVHFLGDQHDLKIRVVSGRNE